MAYETINPATGEHLAGFPEHTSEEVEHALALAHDAYKSWRRTPFEQRASIIRRAAELMREREAQFSRLATLEMGKLIRESRGETVLSADILAYYANRAEEALKPYTIEQQDGEAMVVTEPIGVLLGIQPWNFPYYQVVRFAAPNLMAGNTVILKHSPSVPQCAILLEQLFRDAGAEPGVYTNLRLSNEQSATVIADDRIEGVAVTGSERAGSTVASEAGRALKRTTMELGGSDPYIVLEDANLEKAIDWAVWSRLLNCGQGCVSAKRFIVVEPLYDRFLAGVLARLERIRVGNPMDETTDIGPLSSEAARSRLVNQVERAIRAGAKLVTGGRAIDHDGFYFEPAILTEIRKGNPAYVEEFFGPVFLMFRVQNETALSLANDTSFGLASVIFSEDLRRAHSLARQIEAGMVFINHPAWTAPELPFGGIKRSGYGHELSSLGIQEFVNKKLVRTQAATSPLP